jgi:hypothetical protein
LTLEFIDYHSLLAFVVVPPDPLLVLTKRQPKVPFGNRILVFHISRLAGTARSKISFNLFIN